MDGNPVQQALAEVRDLQKKILEKQRFKGYSGRARAISGTLALITAGVMSLPFYPQTIPAHLLGWTTLFIASIALNFGAIFYWFLLDTKRDLKRLRPLLDVLMPLIVGAILTLTFIMHGQYSYLFGTWMCLFGLANFATRHTVPRSIWIPSLFYVACGTILLVQRDLSFLNPWPMGIVFFIGEWAGGIILHFDGTEETSFREFLNFSAIKEDHHE
ncbi:MAG TPA: hypothetical protein VLH08_12045 [Acidobacteriota bacterium]|nr:hypothetical protein [Acidobacteriota bacterium]